MEKKLFDRLDVLENLTEDAKPEWGKMSAQQMIEHLCLTFRLSNGKEKTEFFGEEEKLPVLKRMLMRDSALPKNFSSPANSKEPLPCVYSGLPDAIDALREEMEDFYECHTDNPGIKFTHPTFGDLDKEEWEHFHNKHITHHFSQFGLM